MNEVVAGLLPLAIAGAIVPTWTSHVILLLGTKRPVLTSSMYVAGITAARIGLGIVVLFFTGTDTFDDLATSASRDAAVGTSTWLIVMGLLLLAPGLLLVLRKPKKEAGEGVPKWLATLEGFPPWAAFLWGVVNFLTPGVQYVYFLGGMTILASANMDQTDLFIWMLAFVAFLDIMLVTPIVLFVVYKEKAAPKLDALKGWLGRNGGRVAGGILAFFGAYLLLRGLNIIG